MFRLNFTRIHCDYMFITLGQKQLGKRRKKHSFARLDQNKQTNKSTISLSKKTTDDCYLIPVENKNSSFIPEKRKARLNHF